MADRATDLQLSVLIEKMRRLERAVSELASDLHGISTTAQLRANGKTSLAAVLDEYRQDHLETTDLQPGEQR